MALPDSLLNVVGNPIVFADHANDFAPAAAVTLEHDTPTDVAMQMASVANGAARQSTKVDLGANRYREYVLRAAAEMAATPTAGSTIDFYWAESHSATAANANPAGISGTNGSYAGYSANLDASVKQLVFIGSMVVTTQATGNVQICNNVGILAPGARYGSLVAYNRAGSAFHSDDVETHFVLDPIGEQIQD